MSCKTLRFSQDPSGCWDENRQGVREEVGAMSRSPLGAGSMLGLGQQRDHNVTPTLSVLLCGKQDYVGLDQHVLSQGVSAGFVKALQRASGLPHCCSPSILHTVRPRRGCR